MKSDDIKTSVTKETNPVLVEKWDENLTETELKENLAYREQTSGEGEEKRGKIEVGV